MFSNESSHIFSDRSLDKETNSSLPLLKLVDENSTLVLNSDSSSNSSSHSLSHSHSVSILDGQKIPRKSIFKKKKIPQIMESEKNVSKEKNGIENEEKVTLKIKRKLN